MSKHFNFGGNSGGLGALAAPDGVAVPGTKLFGTQHDDTNSRYSLPARMIAEAFGTFMLTLGILAPLAFAAVNQGVNWLVVAATAGVMLMAAMAAFGGISGGHFNPAITLGMAIAGRFRWRDVLPYILAQIVGAIAAAFVVWAIIPASFPPLLNLASRNELLATGASGFGERSPLYVLAQGQAQFPLGVALLIEVIFSAILVGVFLGVVRRRPRAGSLAPLTVGLTFAALYLLSWPVTGGGLNPARSLAAAVFGGTGEVWRQLWLFVVGPLIGAALAALFFRALQPIGGPVKAPAFELPGATDPYHTLTAVETVGLHADPPRVAAAEIASQERFETSTAEPTLTALASPHLPGTVEHVYSAPDDDLPVVETDTIGDAELVAEGFATGSVLDADEAAELESKTAYAGAREQAAEARQTAAQAKATAAEAKLEVAEAKSAAAKAKQETDDARRIVAEAEAQGRVVATRVIHED